MAGSAEEAKNESDITPPDSEEEKLGFDNDTLRGKKGKRLPCYKIVRRCFKSLLNRGKCFFFIDVKMQNYLYRADEPSSK